MAGPITKLFRVIRYRRRWHALAATAEAAADKATAELDRRVQDREHRRGSDQRPSVQQPLALQVSSVADK